MQLNTFVVIFRLISQDCLIKKSESAPKYYEYVEYKNPYKIKPLSQVYRAQQVTLVYQCNTEQSNEFSNEQSGHILVFSLLILTSFFYKLGSQTI
jgi:hypothetical protein